MTKFMTIDGNQKTNKETVFESVLDSDFSICDAIYEPKDFDNVLYIGYNSYYGDVFKAWDNYAEKDFFICFDTKGAEFDD